MRFEILNMHSSKASDLKFITNKQSNKAVYLNCLQSLYIRIKCSKEISKIDKVYENEKHAWYEWTAPATTK